MRFLPIFAERTCLRSVLYNACLFSRPKVALPNEIDGGDYTRHFLPLNHNDFSFISSDLPSIGHRKNGSNFTTTSPIYNFSLLAFPNESLGKNVISSRELRGGRTQSEQRLWCASWRNILTLSSLLLVGEYQPTLLYLPWLAHIFAL